MKFEAEGDRKQYDYIIALTLYCKQFHVNPDNLLDDLFLEPEESVMLCENGSKSYFQLTF